MRLFAAHLEFHPLYTLGTLQLHLSFTPWKSTLVNCELWTVLQKFLI